MPKVTKMSKVAKVSVVNKNKFLIDRDPELQMGWKYPMPSS